MAPIKPILTRLSLRCDENLKRAVDAARVDVPREVWLRRAIEEKLARGTHGPENPFSAIPNRVDVVADEHVPKGPYYARSSSQSKRNVCPIPKGKP